MELRNRAEVERDLRGRAAKLSGRHRRELQALLGDPPDWRRVPPEFWERVEQEQNEELLALLLLVFLLNAVQHGAVESGIETIRRVWASARARQTAKNWTQRSRQILQQHGQDWAQRQQKRMRQQQQGLPTDDIDATIATDVDDTLETMFGPARTDGMVETETTAASVAGGEAAAQLLGFADADDYWKTNPHLSATGPCQICEPLNNQPRAVWERVTKLGPPVHPRCVCEIVYARVGAVP